MLLYSMLMGNIQTIRIRAVMCACQEDKLESINVEGNWWLSDSIRLISRSYCGVHYQVHVLRVVSSGNCRSQSLHRRCTIQPEDGIGSLHSVTMMQTGGSSSLSLQPRPRDPPVSPPSTSFHFSSHSLLPSNTF